MRKLILFLVRYNTAFLFIALQVAAFGLIYSNVSYQHTAINAMNSEWSGWVLNTYNNVDDYLNLARINKSLANENASLHESSKEAYFSLTARRDSTVDTLYQQQYTFLSARVINSSFRKRNNYITLNKGRKHGIKADMAVISAHGVVGVVKDVSTHFASVIPLIHGRSLNSVGFQNSAHFGTLYWNGDDYRFAQLRDVPREAKIQVGDTVVSNTRSVSFPSNIVVGLIEEMELDPEEQTYKIKVKLAVDFSALDFVYVVDNLLKAEQLELEQNQDEE